MSTNHILNHTLAEEVARQVVELATVKTELAEERRKREEAEKKLKEPVYKIPDMRPREMRDFRAEQSLSALAAQQALAMQGAQSRYGFGFGSALGNAGSFFG